MPSCRHDCRIRSLASGVAAAWIVAVAGLGCQTSPAAGLTSCPLPTTEQVHEILTIVPLGTPRDDAIARLGTAGITGNFGENQSIYYCDLWKRRDGLRWHINVVLLFDDEGNLYATRPDAAGQVDPSPRSHSTPPPTTRAEIPADPFQP
ncbi:MAG: hypothetical protein SH850_29050 [Planctomycetaceae bacterium]|nr:hypothetical protein [Planctomycetaceae bacterium]